MSACARGLAGSRQHLPFRHGFSSLTRRIVILNLIGLAILVSGILYLNQFRAGLIDAKVQSLLTQGEIIAGALAASAGVDTDQVQLDPEKLLESEAGQSRQRRRRRAGELRWNSPSTPSAPRRSCAAWSSRREAAPASITATAR